MPTRSVCCRGVEGECHLCTGDGCAVVFVNTLLYTPLQSGKGCSWVKSADCRLMIPKPYVSKNSMVFIVVRTSGDERLFL